MVQVDMEALRRLKGSQLVGIDFETYSDVDIRKHGLDRYVSSPYFKPLIVAIAGIERGILVSTSWELDEAGIELLLEFAEDQMLVAHNAAFELAVFRHLGVDLTDSIVDSAVAARIKGASSALGRCGPQLLNVGKLDLGVHLIKQFCVPSTEQVEAGDLVFPEHHRLDPAWESFHEYCRMDAELSYRIQAEDLTRGGLLTFSDTLTGYRETMMMNQAGWTVDLDLVDRMQQQFDKNKEKALEYLHFRVPSTEELNLNSSTQMFAWCKERGIVAKSFDKLNVEKMIAKITKRISRSGSSALPKHKHDDYVEVLEALSVKQIMGGSSLTKLQKIKDLVGLDGQLRNNYIYYGAGQTGRTTGVGVQMQNLKRLPPVPDDVSDVTGWDNEELAANLRQVFTASSPDGLLFVGDFSSVEARALAFIAGEDWVTQAFITGQDLYKMQAAKQFGVSYESVTKEQRQYGKVGVLSCGYGAGGSAVNDFAAAMGIEMTSLESATVVSDFREARPATVALWEKLDTAMRDAITTREMQIVRFADVDVQFHIVSSPASLRELKPEAVTVVMRLMANGNVILRRVFRGCYLSGNEVRYHKPVDGVTLELWRDWYVNPATGKRTPNKLYGGKLTGILVQSYCRQVFMESLKVLHLSLSQYDNVTIIGQFHDEIVVDWRPDTTGRGISKGALELRMRSAMSSSSVTVMPMDVEIKSDYRYTK